MPDKKLTDSEIVKALETCCGDNGCFGCPYTENYSCRLLRNPIKDALDLINRLQAENERLKVKANHYNYCYENFVNTPISRIKAEAYKECIEKAKEELYEWVGADNCVTYPRIKRVLDNLLKELVGNNV